MNNSTLAEAFLDHHAPDNWFRDPNDEVATAVDCSRLTELGDALVDFIAEVISSIIDAGSERDAVNESEALHTVIEEQLRGWSHDPHTTINSETDVLLQRLLGARFGYTSDNNRDLSDGSGSYEADKVEYDVTHAYHTIINYLTYMGG